MEMATQLTTADEILADFDRETMSLQGPVRVQIHVDGETSQGQMILDAFSRCPPDHFVRGRNPHFFVCQSTVFNPLDTYNAPVIVFERIDGANLASHGRKALQDPRVVALLKNSVYIDRQDYNRPNFGGFTRRHEAEIFRCQCGNPDVPDTYWKSPSPQLTDAELAKIDVVAGWESYPQCADAYHIAKTLDPNRERPIDVFFAGTTEYGNSPVDWHRKKCVEAVQSLRGLNVVCHAGRVLSKDEYLTTMAQAKIVACPFGWGETCQRDYEALMLGCELIRPNCGWFMDGGSLASNIWATFGRIKSEVDTVLRLWDSRQSTRDTCADFYHRRREQTLSTLFQRLWLKYIHR